MQKTSTVKTETSPRKTYMTPPLSVQACREKHPDNAKETSPPRPSTEHAQFHRSRLRAPPPQVLCSGQGGVSMCERKNAQLSHQSSQLFVQTVLSSSSKVHFKAPLQANSPKPPFASPSVKSERGGWGVQRAQISVLTVRMVGVFNQCL
ncbi:hypothetical protein FQA47_013784 [Oryzias melastigma]|uniref:Uncharacterized protein n=1 Tax=Oryzias melastigma TaxID=30732 RepID=A0A834F3R1_ORYME|nr:hypothetical protein FQA47_013784 [Oryzias melastigma]